MRSRFIGLLIVGVVLGTLLDASTQTGEAPTPRRSLLAISKVDHVVAIVDPATLKVVGRVPVRTDPHEVVASPDGRTAYVSNTAGGFLTKSTSSTSSSERPCPPSTPDR